MLQQYIGSEKKKFDTVKALYFFQETQNLTFGATITALPSNHFQSIPRLHLQVCQTGNQVLNFLDSELF
jgi:hypothetical protein